MNKANIGIIDYNTGNIESVKNACLKIGAKASVFSEPSDIFKYDKVILPGVGAFGDAMEHIKKYELDKAIKEYAKSGKHILGICLGAQVLFDKSYEFGENQGLGLIDGEVVSFDTKITKSLKIPHMGWNIINHSDNKLFKDLNKNSYCYFVHSFHIKCDKKYILATTNYGYEFASIVNKENIFGIQPHPEKSHNNGLKILDNFIKI